MMKKLILIIILSFLPVLGIAQDIFRLYLDSSQPSENGYGHSIGLSNSPLNGIMLVMGGLKNVDGSGNYLELFGSKLIIDSVDQNFDGTRRIVLIREDGRNFLELFPRLYATLKPVNLIENENLENTITD